MELGYACWYLGLLGQSALLLWRLLVIFWYTYTVNSRSHIKNTNVVSFATIRAEHRATICALICVCVLFWFGSTLSGTIGFLYINLWQVFCVSVVLLLLCILILVMERTGAGATLLTVESLVLFGFISIACILVLSASNLLFAFFVIELVGFVILYAMLVLYGYRTLLPTVAANSAIVASLTYQFILNFLSSVLFYGALSALLYYHGSLGLSSASIWGWVGSTSVWSNMALVALFIKFGAGPWVFYKLRIYNGLSLLALALYTIVYFSVLLIFFFNLLFVFGLPVDVAIVSILLSMAVSAILFFSSTVFQQGNVLLILGLSSLLNTTLFLAQLGSLLA